MYPCKWCCIETICMDCSAAVLFTICPFLIQRGITFEQAKSFSDFVSDIDTVDNAMSIYVAGRAALNIGV